AGASGRAGSAIVHDGTVAGSSGAYFRTHVPRPGRSRGREEGPVRAKMGWLFRRRLCFGGLAGALVFFCLSLTPSLLPRGDILQGVLSGITAVIGYGAASALSAGIRKIRSSEPGLRFKRIAWWVLLGATVLFVPLFLVLGGHWQNDVRDLMGMSEANAWDWLAIGLLTVVFALLLLLI